MTILSSFFVTNRQIDHEEGEEEKMIRTMIRMHMGYKMNEN